jgi:hypothetical protein
MDVEEEMFALMKAAKDQQAAVERATAEFARERKATAQQNAAFLQGAEQLMSQFRALKDQLAKDTATGIKTAVAGVADDVAAPIKTEVQTAVKSLAAIRESLDNGARWLAWRYIVAFMVMAFALGYVASWSMNTRSLNALTDQIGLIQQSIQQQQPQHVNTTRRGRP